MRAAAAALLCAAGRCAGHGSMCSPPSWSDPDGKYGCGDGHEIAGCTATCAPYSPGSEKCGGRAAGQIEQYEGCVSEWYTNWTFIPGNPTIPDGSPLKTQRSGTWLGDWSAKNPWRAPGSAPVFSPCGVDGGNPKGCPPGNPSPYAPGTTADPSCGAGGYGHGPYAVDVLKGNTRPTVWAAGGTVEVKWGIAANHGGGYAYRLCPRPKKLTDLTEECFQQMPLRLLGDTTWAELPNGTRIPIPAMRTEEGTTPAGSQWTRLPIPGCYDPVDPAADGVDGMCPAAQFPEPFPGAVGFLSNFYPTAYIPAAVRRLPNMVLVDKLEVPANLTPGDYVLSFRYDTEQTPQVWNSCSDIRVTKP